MRDEELDRFNRLHRLTETTPDMSPEDREWVETRLEWARKDRAEYDEKMARFLSGELSLLDDLNRYENRHNIRPYTKRDPRSYKFANFHGYSDVEPYEIVRFLTDRKIEIRAMKCGDCPTNMDELGFIAGGFVGHYANQRNQKWIIESDPEMPIRVIRLHKNGDWKSVGGMRYVLSDKPHKFYDFNF